MPMARRRRGHLRRALKLCARHRPEGYAGWPAYLLIGPAYLVVDEERFHPAKLQRTFIDWAQASLRKRQREVCRDR
jgi:hypothetical protein